VFTISAQQKGMLPLFLPRDSTLKPPAAGLLLGSSFPGYREYNTLPCGPLQCELIPTSDEDKTIKTSHILQITVNHRMLL